MLKVFAWLLLAACAAAWLMACAMLAVSAGGPNYTLSGLSQAEIASRTASYQWALLLFRVLPMIACVDMVVLWCLTVSLRALKIGQFFGTYPGTSAASEPTPAQVPTLPQREGEAVGRRETIFS